MGSLSLWKKKKKKVYKNMHIQTWKIWGAGQNESLISLPPSIRILWTSQRDFSGAHSDIKQNTPHKDVQRGHLTGYVTTNM